VDSPSEVRYKAAKLITLSLEALRRLFVIKLNTIISMTLMFALFGCGTQENLSILSLNPLTESQKQQDFDQLISQVKGMYAPLQYKEKRFAFKFDEFSKKIKAQALKSKTDDEFYDAISTLVGKFKDGHISVSLPDHISKVGIPIFVTPVEDKVLVSTVDEELEDEGIAKGDEIISVDGVEPLKYLPLFTRYSSFANETSDKHLIYHLFNRPSYFTGSIKLDDGKVLSAIPTQPKAKIVFKRVDGSSYTRDLIWRTKKSKSSTTEFIDSPVATNVYSSSVAEFLDTKISLEHFGASEPFFVNSTTISSFNFRRIFVDESDKLSLARFNLSPENIKKDVYAAIYRHENKIILLIRQPGYSVSDIPNHIKTYQVILAQNESLADVLVIDQTHNPGGDTDYLEGFTSLFAKENFRSYTQFMNADRKWLTLIRDSYNKLDESKQQSEEGQRSLFIASAVEQAIDSNKPLTDAPYSFNGKNYIRPNEDYTWTKPILVLADELAGSCGDLFPMMMKRNKRAKIFGQRTMGLGGSVEPMEALTHSRVVVKLTRGLLVDYKEDGVYSPEDYIENNGVKPDYQHNITIEDFRDDYVGYVEAFSNKAIKQIKK